MKTEMIDARFHFVWTITKTNAGPSRRCRRPSQTLCRPSLRRSHDRQTRDACEVNRPIYVADVDGDVRPTAAFSCGGRLARRLPVHFAETINSHSVV
jgi:hypothetical protein